MVVNDLYQAKASDVSADMEFSDDFIARILHDIYRRGKAQSSTDLSSELFRAILQRFNEATDKGISLCDGVSTPSSSAAPDPDNDFRHALQHSNEVFSAFKVHRMQTDMAKLLTDSNGDLKPFNQWANDVLPIASHQCGAWLRTEYDTAVIRAHQAADWQQFVREADVLPNLKWMPSTSPHPGADHMVFWNTVRPVNDPFWNEHRPGDRWNCKCSLASTDEPATAKPTSNKDSDPQPGLDTNPGTSKATFSQSHPYFPQSCSSCSFYKPGFKSRLRTLFTNRTKDCYNCPYINGCIHSTEEKKKIDKERAKELKTEAAFLREEVLKNKEFSHDVTISQKKIKEWLNQPHKFYREKNELLLDLPEVFKKAVYKGETIDPKVRPGVGKSHIFEIELCGEPSYIIIHEMTWHEYQIHSISDHIKM